MEEAKDKLKKNGYKVVVNSHDNSFLSKQKPNTAILVTELILMRGYNYRREEIGKDIVLLLVKKMPTTRDYGQALGRVGRYGDFCERYKLPGFSYPAMKRARH